MKVDARTAVAMSFAVNHWKPLVAAAWGAGMAHSRTRPATWAATKYTARRVAYPIARGFGQAASNVLRDGTKKGTPYMAAAAAGYALGAGVGIGIGAVHDKFNPGKNWSGRLAQVYSSPSTMASAIISLPSNLYRVLTQ